MLTEIQQIKMALALLGWSRKILAEKSGLSVSTVTNYLSEVHKATPANRRAMICAIAETGVRMTPEGVHPSDVPTPGTPDATPTR